MQYKFTITAKNDEKLSSKDLKSIAKNIEDYLIEVNDITGLYLSDEGSEMGVDSLSVKVSR